MNWISATGLSPCAAIPTQSPLISSSESGVSRTRSTPKRRCKPDVARKPPPFVPTSSPNTTTSGSSAKARASARLIASTSVSSTTGLILDFLALPRISSRKPGIEMVEHGLWRRRSRGQIAFYRALHVFLALGCDFLFLRFAPTHVSDEISSQPRDRLLFPALLHFLRRPIARGIVSGSVIAESIGYGLDQAWPVTDAGCGNRRFCRGAHRDDVVAIDLLSPDPSEIHCFPQVALGGCAIANDADSNARLFAVFEGVSDPRRMRSL